MSASAIDTYRAAVLRDGLSATARTIGVSRSTLGSYLAGACREGTTLLVESRVGRLSTINEADKAA